MKSRSCAKTRLGPSGILVVLIVALIVALIILAPTECLDASLEQRNPAVTLQAKVVGIDQ